MKSDIKRMIRNGIFFIVIFVLTYIVIFSKIDLKAIVSALKNSNIFLVILAFIFAFNNILFESINLKRNFNLLGDKVKFCTCLKYSIIGFFYSSITPASSGGQPMQLYEMNKDGISVSHGASALFISFIAYMLTAVILAIIGFIINYEYISEIALFKYLIYIGLVANSLIISAILIAMFAKKLSHKILNLITSIVEKINPKKAKSIKISLSKQLDDYHASASFILKHKKATLLTFLISFLQIISIHSVAYLIFSALGYCEYPYIYMLLLQSVVFISVSAIPLPGTIGVSETGFALMYRNLFPTAVVETSMLLTRGVSFYILVVFSAIILLILKLVKRRKQRK